MQALRRVVAIGIVTSFVLAFYAEATKAVEVTFPDAGLEAKVRSTLNIPTGPITDADMATMGVLKAGRRSISNFQGLEFATNLTTLDLHGNNITDISPVSGLTNLNSLFLGNNKINDISLISGLTNLTSLDLFWNKITDISAVAGLTNLSSLSLRSNDITDISAVSGLTNLSSLSLRSNEITDISPISGLTNLSSLSLRNNDITDISPVSGLTNLNSLSLRSNDIIDISPVSGLTNLNSLSLRSNDITDISAVSGLTNLTLLDLGGNDITDISSVSGLTSLATLDLGGNDITDISSVSGLTNLSSLFLSGNDITDISSVSGLVNLVSLYLYSNQIETMDLRGANLASLEEFSIGNNPLTKVLLVDAVLSERTFNRLMDGGSPSRSGIAELDGVLNLDMSGVDFGDISDFSAMYTMDDLEELFLVGATNLDGSEVVAMTNELDALDWLDVTGVWESFGAAEQGLLCAWDALEGNTLITEVPEPGMVGMLAALAGFAVFYRKRRQGE